MRKQLILLAAALSALAASASAQTFFDRTSSAAQAQTQMMVEKLSNTLALPSSAPTDGSKLVTCGLTSWVSGFFPGTLWRLYELTGDSKWKAYARIWNWKLEPLRSFSDHHDVGFMVGCSFGNGYRLTSDEEYSKIIVDAAAALCTRFDEKVGAIRSWNNPDPNKYLVIIDNMMNLELLFMATKISGDKKFYDIAVKHALTTLKNHFRPDGSSYHVVDYNPSTGGVNKKHTAQGYADESAWARGQAWGLYGFTMMYRETGDKKFLDQAEKIASFLLGHKNLPEDNVFYWDFNAPDIPAAPRDVSATCIAASALLELSDFSKADGDRYFTAAEKMLESLSRPPYLAPVGENQNFILTSSVGNYPGNSQITVPLNYADYYCIEALIRYKEKIDKRNPISL